jgi:hypothetical protein
MATQRPIVYLLPTVEPIFGEYALLEAITNANTLPVQS